MLLARRLAATAVRSEFHIKSGRPPPRLLAEEVNDGRVAVKGTLREPRTVFDAKPTASLTVEPYGLRSSKPRPHTLRLVLRFSGSEPKFADRSCVVPIARSAMDAMSAELERDPPTFSDVLGKTQAAVIGIEVSTICAGRPDPSSIDQLRRVLVAAGYGFAAREVHECAEDGCTTTTVGDYARPLEVPAGWFDAHACGRHGYKRCALCASTYVMTCENATTAAPAVHCTVCSHVLVEWGSTKQWTAELVRRADWPRSGSEAPKA